MNEAIHESIASKHNLNRSIIQVYKRVISAKIRYLFKECVLFYGFFLPCCFCCVESSSIHCFSYLITSRVQRAMTLDIQSGAAKLLEIHRGLAHEAVISVTCVHFMYHNALSQLLVQ